MFLDIGGGEQDDFGAGNGNSGDSSKEAIEIDKELERLTGEWDTLWKELESLCTDDDDDQVHVLGTHNNTTVGTQHYAEAAASSQNSIDLTQNDYGERDVADICAMFDLTQTQQSSPVAASARPQTQPIVQSHSAKASSDASVQSEEDDDTKETQQQQRQARIKQVLQRLDEIHTTLLDLQPTTSSSTNFKHTQRLKTKLLSLQKANSSYQSQITTLQTENTNLSTKHSKMQQSLFDHTLETERESRKAESLRTQYTNLLGQFASYQDQSQLKINALQESNQQLKQKLNMLQDQSALQDVQEMEEIRMKYSSMSQTVHDVKQRNNRLERRLEQMQSEKEQRTFYWERKIEEERTSLEKEWEGRLRGERTGYLSRIRELQLELNSLKGGNSGDGGKKTQLPQRINMVKRQRVESGGIALEKENIVASTGSRVEMRPNNCPTIQTMAADGIRQGGRSKDKQSNTNARTGTTIPSTNKPTISKAMFALDSAPSRKSIPSTAKRGIQRQHSLQQQHTTPTTNSRNQSSGNIGKWYEEEEKEEGDEIDIQVFMRTKNASSKPSTVHRHGSVGISSGSNDSFMNSAKAPIPIQRSNTAPVPSSLKQQTSVRGAIGTKTKSTGSNKALLKQKQPASSRNISSFFKPV